jgi:VanZ family protein
MRALVRWLPFGLACVAVWIVSSMPRPPVPLFLQFEHADELLHFLGYAVLGSLALLGVGPRPLLRNALVALALVAIWGICDEWHQSFVPGRDASLTDFAAVVAGAALGAGLLGWWTSRHAPKARKES